MFQGHCLSGISDLVTVEFRKNNGRFSSPTLTDKRALTLVTDTARRSTVGDTAVMCDLKRIIVQYIFKVGVQTLGMYSVWRRNV